MDKIANSIFEIRDFFKGKKTIIVGTLMIILGLYNNDNQMILEGIGFITIRSGVANLK
jgi:hypothetical protein